MYVTELRNAAGASGGLLVAGDADLPIRGVFTDSRSPLSGGLFVAIGGERYDGHAFVEAALAAGAAAVLVSRREALKVLEKFPGRGAILSGDTREAYLRLALDHRLRLSSVLWVGITGSTGKTTIKEMLSHVLAVGAGWKVHRAERSFNNEIGLPATILAASGEHHVAVLELGTNHRGEIARLAAVARPHVAVISNAGPCHLEAFETVDGVAEEKSHLLDFQSPADTAVLNADDPHFSYWRAKIRGRLMAFGLGGEAQIRGENLEEVPGLGARFRLTWGGRGADAQLRLPGRHSVSNALAAAAAALSAGVNLEAIAAALSSFSGAERRYHTQEVRGVTVIDDAYNASPMSFSAALDCLSHLTGRRAFVVAGDMLELGQRAEALHDELGAALAALAPFLLVTVGPLANRSGAAAAAAGLPRQAWRQADSPEDAARILLPLLRPGDVVLVKGSHGMNLERCVAALVRPGSA